jgi:hypothetical protein
MLLVAVAAITDLMVVRLILGVLRLAVAVAVLMGLVVIALVLVPAHAALGIPLP